MQMIGTRFSVFQANDWPIMDEMQLREYLREFAKILSLVFMILWKIESASGSNIGLRFIVLAIFVIRQLRSTMGKQSILLLLSGISQSSFILFHELDQTDTKNTSIEASRTHLEVDLIKTVGTRRVLEIDINGFTSQTPFSFSSFSSAQSGLLQYTELVELICITVPPRTLVSAYDLSSEQIDQLNKAADKRILIVDSGGFETKVSKTRKPWNVERYASVVERLKADIVVSFDKAGLSMDQQIKENKRLLGMLKYKRRENFLFDYVLAGFEPPVLRESEPRISESEKRKSFWEGIQERVSKYRGNVSNAYQSYKFRSRVITYLHEVLVNCDIDIVGIPDAILGTTPKSKLQSIRRIAGFLRSNYDDVPIHIFGVGDPEVIPKYYRCGADIFDGTSWYRRVLWQSPDENDGSVFSMSEQVFLYQKIHQYCDCPICDIQRNNEKRFRPTIALLLHNIWMYQDLMDQLRRDTMSYV